MIILFEENETQFNSLGIGILKDAIDVNVTEKLNDTFELTMSYPVNGKDYDKLKVNRLIYCKPNPYDEAQPFRIYSITKPIKGVVTVDAVHISYDMNGIPVNAITSENLPDLISKIQNEAVVENEFTFTTDIMSGKSYKTTQPFNLRAILMGGEESIVETYKAEVKFDKFMVKLLRHRGEDRNATVTYGHNMTDLKHQSSTETLFNGVFPYFHTEKTSTETSTEDKFKQVYVVGSAPFQENWLSYTKDGEPYHPLDDTPVQVASDGKYKDKVYCWNEIYLRYEEKIYNEQVTLIQGLLEPTWLSIDWSKFPKVICKANRKGYFKKATDNDWGEIKGVGDTIFEGSIVSSGIIENIILYFAEVIPTSGSKANEEVSEIVDVQLDEKIIWLQTPEAQAMKYNRILSLDLTSEFDEEPSKERLRAKAEEYINDNKIGTVRHETSVSFIDVSRTTDANKYKNFDRIELGDTVRVRYLDMGVDVPLRVVSTQYDPISDRYINVELGEKKEKMSSESIQTGDNISSLTNDIGYASTTTVHKLIADTVTANYIEAVNAKMSQAMIKQLTVEKIECPGIIEASQYVIDKLVATLITADNAVIKDTLTAGKIKVAGDISIYSGNIKIQDEEGGETFFRVDRQGNVTANSVAITGGTFNINEGVFEVLNDGSMYATNAFISGEIHATAGNIGGAEIIDGVLQIKKANISEKLTADQIDVVSVVAEDYINTLNLIAKKIEVKDNGNVLFLADVNNKDVTIGGFDVDYNSITSGSKGYDGYVNISKGSLNITLENVPGESHPFVRAKEYDITDYHAYASTIKGMHSTRSVSKVVFNKDFASISLYIRSYAEDGSDYSIISTLNASSVPVSSTSSNVAGHTRDNHNTSDRSINGYLRVTYTNVKAGDYVYVIYTKDSEDSVYDDTGYLLIPTEQAIDNLLELGKNFSVDYYGNLNANDVNLTGYVHATSGLIGNCEIKDGILEIQGSLKAVDINIGNGQFVVTDSGRVEAKEGLIGNCEIKDGILEIQGSLKAVDINIGQGSFMVDAEGNLKTSNPIVVSGMKNDNLDVIDGNVKNLIVPIDGSVKIMGHKIDYSGPDLSRLIDVEFKLTQNIVKSYVGLFTSNIVVSCYQRGTTTLTSIPSDTIITVQTYYGLRYTDGRTANITKYSTVTIRSGESSASATITIKDDKLDQVTETIPAPGHPDTYDLSPSFIRETKTIKKGDLLELDSRLYAADLLQDHPVISKGKVCVPIVNHDSVDEYTKPQIIPYTLPNVGSRTWSSTVDLKTAYGVSTILAVTAMPIHASGTGTPTAAQSPYLPYVWFSGSQFRIRNTINGTVSYSCIIVAV